MKNQGTSLTELMIASSLGLFCILSVLHFYLQQRTFYHYQQSLAQIQENGRTAWYILNRALRNIGYVGCANLQHIQLAQFSPATAIVGYANGYSSSGLKLPANIAQQVLPQTDALQLSSLHIEVPDLRQTLFKAASLLTIPTPIMIKDSFYVISDCGHAELHRLIPIASGHVYKLIPPIINVFSEHAQLGVLQQQLFYIANTKRLNSQDQAITALYRYVIATPTMPQEIIEGVEDFKIYYGLLDQRAKLNYLTADKLNYHDWAKVKSIRIHLLLTSIEPVLEAPQSYRFNDRQITATDRRLRREWQTTIALRER